MGSQSQGYWEKPAEAFIPLNSWSNGIIMQPESGNVQLDFSTALYNQIKQNQI